MNRVRPILFNGRMVEAILDGRKTATRRTVRYKYDNTEIKMKEDKYGARLIEIQKNVEGETYGKNPDGSTWHKLRPYIDKQPPCRPGDILYVRETWAFVPCIDCNIGELQCREDPVTYDDGDSISEGCFIYRDGHTEPRRISWRPSIHMPRLAARIWLRVTDVRAERLQKILKDPPGPDNQVVKEGCRYTADFIAVWENTIRKSERNLYGWNANPWVWVIEFERCEKPAL